jgi:hypothetical protein
MGLISSVACAMGADGHKTSAAALAASAVAMRHLSSDVSDLIGSPLIVLLRGIMPGSEAPRFQNALTCSRPCLHFCFTTTVLA